MLKIYVTSDFPERTIINVNGYFNLNKEKDWFNNPIVKRIIKDIDNTDAIKDEYLESPVLGAISPDRLSGGCKAVILMQVLDNAIIYGTKCGDNCVQAILDVAKNKDVEMLLHHCMKFPKSGFEAMIMESGKIVHTRKEFVDEYYTVNS